MRILLFLLLTLPFFTARAQEWNTTVPKEIVILHSTKDYNAALKTAQAAAKKMGRRLELGGNRPNKQLGLTLSKADCEGSAYDYPCYTARGNGVPDSDDFISIEYSDAYEGFREGYYIVVAMISEPGSDMVRNALSAARKHYPDAYAKRTRVWFGCMH